MDLYVADRFTGWRERALVNLSELYNHESHAFPANVSEQMVTRVSLVLHYIHHDVADVDTCGTMSGMLCCSTAQEQQAQMVWTCVQAS